MRLHHLLSPICLAHLGSFNPLPKSCPPVEGDFTLEIQNLYPESAAFDPYTCKLYLSSTYNVSLVIYDPYTRTSETLVIPGLTADPSANYTEYHMNGVDFDPISKNIYLALSSAKAFDGLYTGDYSEEDYTDPNRILRFDPQCKEIVADVNLITFGNSVAKISYGSDEASLWYSPEHYNETYGFGGIISLGNKLIISNTLSGGLITFDTSQSVGHAKEVPLRNLPSNYRTPMADGLFAPSKYQGRVALWSDDYNGTSVYGSTDEWQTAHFLGLVPNNAQATKEGGLPVATFEIGDSIFAMVNYFQSSLPVVERKRFPMFDITAKVDEFVRRSSIWSDNST